MLMNRKAAAVRFHAGLGEAEAENNWPMAGLWMHAFLFRDPPGTVFVYLSDRLGLNHDASD